MLSELYIKNLATIAELCLTLDSGATVVTGETGAGKSLIIEAIELALGKRASIDRIRHDAQKLDISLTFTLSDKGAARAWLTEHDYGEDSTCTIRRVITREGRSTSYINGIPTTLNPVRELAEQLIDIHGQHEHQALFKAEYQLALLDKYAEADDLVTEVRSLYQKWRVANDELARLQAATQTNNERLELLKFQLQEFDAINPIADEFAILDKEQKNLAHADKLLTDINAALNLCAAGDNGNGLSLIQEALGIVAPLQSFGERLQHAHSALQEAAVNIEDARAELRDFVESIDQNPERLNEVEARLSALFNLARKYHIYPEELPAFHQKLKAELQELDNSDERLNKLQSEVLAIQDEYNKAATEISTKRAAAATKLEQEITTKINQLGFQQAAFKINFNRKEDGSLSANGLETIEFLVRTNPGFGLAPLRKIASGGEISRISLAIHIVMFDKDIMPCLVFDEVDAGIGGTTAETVGTAIRTLGETNQVICITHLTQVATKGHHHILVQKTATKDSTITTLTKLNTDERKHEIARMLAGSNITTTTLDHAQELLATDTA